MKDEIVMKPLKLQSYTCKQYKHAIVPRLPLRCILLAPSGSGETVLLGISYYMYTVTVLKDYICSVHQFMLTNHGKQSKIIKRRY